MINQTTKVKQLYCCGCSNQSTAILVSGKDVYPHRLDLHNLPFWQCKKCKNFVGCHYKTKNPTKPLGVIPTPELKKARQHIHALIDPLWQPKNYHKRGVIYRIIAKKIAKKEYHTAKIRSIEEAREIYLIAKQLPKLLIEEEENRKAIEKDYLFIRPIEGKKYLVKEKDGWKEYIFQERKKWSCSLHGEPYLTYIFKNDKESARFTIDADIPLDKRTEQLKNVIKNIN